MSVPLTLLGLLDREPSHGYDLKREYDSYVGRGKTLSFGQVYATLARLTRDGKALAKGAEPGSGPERKRYVITEVGKEEVEAWFAQPIEPEPHLQTELFAKVVLSLMLGRSAERISTSSAAHISSACANRPKSSGTVLWSTASWPTRAFPPRSGASLDRPYVHPAQRPGRGGVFVTLNDVKISHFRADELLEIHKDEEIWELMYFGHARQDS